jgi:hypothetical protein
LDRMAAGSSTSKERPCQRRRTEAYGSSIAKKEFFHEHYETQSP